jgi:hypothetical protein
LSDAQLAGIGYSVSGIGFVVSHATFYISPWSDLKMKRIPLDQYRVPDTECPLNLVSLN